MRLCLNNILMFYLVWPIHPFPPSISVSYFFLHHSCTRYPFQSCRASLMLHFLSSTHCTKFMTSFPKRSEHTPCALFISITWKKHITSSSIQCFPRSGTYQEEKWKYFFSPSTNRCFRLSYQWGKKPLRTVSHLSRPIGRAKYVMVEHKIKSIYCRLILLHFIRPLPIPLLSLRSRALPWRRKSALSYFPLSDISRRSSFYDSKSTSWLLVA